MMLIIGIAGGTGSGKTTVVERLVRENHPDEVVVLSQDNYYKNHPDLSFSERESLNYDHPNSIDFPLLKNHISALQRGESIIQPVYSFVHHARTDQTLKVYPKKVLIVEGILVFTDIELLKLYSVKIFVHADADERLIRRINRDTAERGRSLEEVLHRYRTTLKPMHEQFIEPSKTHADIIIPNMKSNEVAADFLSALIQKTVRNA